MSRSQANPWVEVPIVTGLSEARNVLIARSAHAVVALPGGFGTLSEIAFCLHFGTPVVALTPPGTTGVPYPLESKASSARAACDWIALRLDRRPRA